MGNVGSVGVYVGVGFVGLEASEHGRRKLRRIVRTANDYKNENEPQVETHVTVPAGPDS